MHNTAWILSTGQNGLLGYWICPLPTSLQIHSDIPSPLNNGVLPFFKTHLEVTSSRKLSLTAPGLTILSLPHPTGLLWHLSVLFSRHSGQTPGIPTYLPKIGHISPTSQQTRAASPCPWCLARDGMENWTENTFRVRQTHYGTLGGCLNLLGPIFTCVLVNTSKMMTGKGPRTGKRWLTGWLFVLIFPHICIVFHN